MIRFLHVADLHLGMRITRFDENACSRIGEARFEAVEEIRNKAAEHRVHFILIAGDMFDDHTVSPKVVERAFSLFEGKSVSCPVYIIPGNHDPLTPGGIWDREPWKRDRAPKNVRLLRQSIPEPLHNLPVTLFPCPLQGRNSTDDPTAWIANYPRQPGDSTIRIGLAHGSLKIKPDLPLDDHLIRKDAADFLGLDYLALGHWHKPLRFNSADGTERTAYSGTHEPMRFPKSRVGESTGWLSHSLDGDAERFEDDGFGKAQLVTIAEAGAPPVIETIEVGRLRWLAETLDMTSQPVGELISKYAQTPHRELTILQLRLFGVVEYEKYRRIETEVYDIIRRYYTGSSIRMDELLIEPNPEQLTRLVGDGVLARVLDRLREDRQSNEHETKRTAEHALNLLFRVASEEQE